jgi:hypothetical protein
VADSDLSEGLKIGTDAIPPTIKGKEQAYGATREVGGTGLVDDGFVGVDHFVSPVCVLRWVYYA